MNEEVTTIVNGDGSFGEGWTSALPETIRESEAFGEIGSIGDLAAGYLKSRETPQFDMESYKSGFDADFLEQNQADLDKFKNPQEIYKSFREVQKMATRKGDIPKSLEEGGTEEQWNEFYSKLGRPEDVSGYKLDVPEGIEISDEYKNSIAELGMKHNLTSSQLQGLVSDWMEMEKGLQTSANDAATASWNERLGRVDKEWGSAKEEMDSAVQNLVKHYGYEADMENIASPEAMLLLGAIAKDMDENGQVGNVFNSTRQGMETQVNELNAELINLMRTEPDNPRVEIIQGQIQDLKMRSGAWTK